jgi:hypothetical protein
VRVLKEPHAGKCTLEKEVEAVHFVLAMHSQAAAAELLLLSYY